MSPQGEAVVDARILVVRVRVAGGVKAARPEPRVYGDGALSCAAHARARGGAGACASSERSVWRGDAGALPAPARPARAEPPPRGAGRAAAGAAAPRR